MLKWIGRILYVIIVFLFTTTVGIGEGIVLSEYYEKVVLQESNDFDRTVSTYLGMDYSYYGKESLLDNQIVVDATRDEINVKFGLQIYPLGSLRTNVEDNLIFDGLVFYMDGISSSENFILSHFTYQFKVKNTITNEISDLYVVDNSYVYIVVPPSNETISGIPKGLMFVTEANMKSIDPKKPEKAEYEILTMDIFGHGYLKDDETKKDQNIHLYKGYKDGHTGDGNPVELNNNFVLNREDYMLSAITNLTELPTAEDLVTYNIGFVEANYSPYFYWYWVIGFLYIGLLLVIPYFWFFHVKVMENHRARKKVKLQAAKRKLSNDSRVVEAEFTDKK